MKKYWLVRPDSYNYINKILDSNYTDYQIDFFKNKYPKGIYLTNMFKDTWGFMPWIEFNGHSEEWLIENGYEYIGEIISIKKQRKEKLERLNEKSL